MAAKSILVPLAAPVLNRRFLRGNEDEPQSSSVIFVRKDSRFHNFQDLQGAVFAFNDHNSLSGFYSMKFHIHKGGYSTPYFSGAVETGGHQRSLEALLCEEADCAAVDVDVVRRLRKNRLWRQRMMELRKLEDVGELGPYPAQPFVIPSYFSEDVIEKFRDALCSATFKELKPLNWSKLSPVSAETYDPITRLLEACKDKVIICPKDCYSKFEIMDKNSPSSTGRRNMRRKVNSRLDEGGSQKKRARC